MTQQNWVNDRGGFCAKGYSSTPLPPIYGVDRAGMSSNMTEVHALDGNTDYNSFVIQKATVLPLVGADPAIQSLMGDYNGDGFPDFWVVSKAHTRTGHAELCFLDGANQFQTYLRNCGPTALITTDSEGVWQFALGYFNRGGRLNLFWGEAILLGT